MPLAEVAPGDILVCRAGERIGVDGVITAGRAHFDSAFLTGESYQKSQTIGDKVWAGMINLDSEVTYQAQQVGRDSMISQITQLVEQTIHTKAPISRLADRISGILVPMILVISGVTFWGHWSLTGELHTSLAHAVSVLVIACPCALGLATPMATTISIATAARRGILFKSSAILEKTSQVSTIVFDKTGTLTRGQPHLVDLEIFDPHWSPKEILDLAASIEQSSRHPLARAFTIDPLDYQPQLKPVVDWENLDGVGVIGRVNGRLVKIGNLAIVNESQLPASITSRLDQLAATTFSVSLITIDDQLVAAASIADQLRPEAATVISHLHHQGQKIALLSGDRQEAVAAVSRDLPLDVSRASLTPLAKAQLIRDWQDRGEIVMMIGDGINDAPSLSLADVGVSLASGTQIAADSSQIILLADDLQAVEQLLTISQRTMRIIKQNLFWAFAYNLIMIPLAAGVPIPPGVSISPVWASGAMVASSLLVIANSLRLRR